VYPKSVIHFLVVLTAVVIPVTETAQGMRFGVWVILQLITLFAILSFLWCCVGGESRIDCGFVSEVAALTCAARSNLRFLVGPVLGVEAVLVVAVK
jgi:hypothetical protein